MCFHQKCIVVRVELHSGMKELGDILFKIHEETVKNCVEYYGLLGKRSAAIKKFLQEYSIDIPIVGGGIARIHPLSMEMQFTERLLQIWSKLQNNIAAIIIIIDEAERLAEIPGALEYLRNTFSRLAENKALYCVIISGQLDLFLSVVKIFRPLERFFKPITLMPLRQDEVHEVLEKATDEIQFEFDDEVKREIAQISEGQPYVVQLCGEHLLAKAIEDNIKIIDSQLLEIVKPIIYEELRIHLFNRRISEGIGGERARALQKT